MVIKISFSIQYSLSSLTVQFLRVLSERISFLDSVFLGMCSFLSIFFSHSTTVFFCFSFSISSFLIFGSISLEMLGIFFTPIASFINVSNSVSEILSLYFPSPCLVMLERLLTNIGMYLSIKPALFSIFRIFALLLRYILNRLPIASRQYLISFRSSSSSAKAFLLWLLNIK